MGPSRRQPLCRHPKRVALATGGRITLLRVPEDHRNPAEFLLDDDIAEDDLRVRARDLADNGLKVDW
jgi:hypothetical protein